MLYYPIMDIEAQLLELVRRTACEAPEDVLEALARAREAEGEPARGTLGTILENCALAKAVRKRLRAMGVQKGIPVVFSTELANPEAVIEVTDEQCKRTTTGTVSYMPAIFGCFLASHVIRNLI